MWINEWGGEILWSHGVSNSRGVAILVKPGLNIIIQDTSNGRLLIITAKIQDSEFVITNLYAPNSEDGRLLFVRQLKNIMENKIRPTHNMMICGYFNHIMNPQMDRKGGIMREFQKCKDTTSCIDDIADRFDLGDIWRKRNLFELRFTWRGTNPKVYSRLDYWYISNNLYDSIEEADIVPSTKSDHSAVTLKLKGR